MHRFLSFPCTIFLFLKILSTVACNHYQNIIMKFYAKKFALGKKLTNYYQSLPEAFSCVLTRHFKSLIIIFYLVIDIV